MSKTALIVVDVQNDYFPHGKWPLVGMEAAAGAAARAIVAARDKGDLVVFIRHEFEGDNAPFFAAGSEGAKLHSTVANLKDEPVLLKHDINAFQGTGLRNVLDDNDVKSVVIVGAMSHMCVDAASRAAKDFGYGVTVLHDACATLDLEFNGVKTPASQVQAAYMSALQFGYASVVSTSEYLSKAG